jgi:uncharacterized membrane protein
MGQKALILGIIFVLVFALMDTSSALYDTNIYRLNATYILQQNNSVNEYLEFTFSTAVNKSVFYKIDYNTTDISVNGANGTINYTIYDDGKQNVLNITVTEPLTKLLLSYVTVNGVFQKDMTNLFYKDFSFTNLINKLDVTVSLPSGYTIYNDEFSPKDAHIFSDGQKINLAWSETNILKGSSFSVRFSDPSQISSQNITIGPGNTSSGIENLFNLPSTLTKLIIFILGLPYLIILVIVIVLVLLLLRTRKKVDEGLLKGFSEDEQKAISFIQKNGSVWQNKLRHEFGFSRAKSTRIIKKLEAGGLVKKEEFGKTNRISWVK